ncbi:hypothetical protein CLG96_05440 [Sphingomonas oleivorans]|uniref:Uncharacterized protein n=2 Tax=Sphingomonas oleivorans TaxID=1735121 RepID=A0A2T5FZA1_9SPHN|nr:hypothetical protein CLG96_05440 [Sphingomonas oleivorans]
MIERYLKRLGFWLPVGKRREIVMELRGVLLDRVEAAEAAQGRALTEAETRRILDEFGPAMLVAARYLQGPPVISGMLAFIYWRVLAIAFTAIVTVQLILIGVHITSGSGFGPLLRDAANRTLIGLLLGFFCVTASFMIIERCGGRRPG